MSRSDTRPQSEIRRIRQHLSSLKQQPWLSSAQRWWPDFLFHCTDVRNVVSILRAGKMLSRTHALASNELLVDIASPEVIAQTDEKWQDYVRLYLRPRTPTQYRNEGFQPVEQQTYHAQCPVPVYLLLDAVQVLSHIGVLFTEGSVANGAGPTDSLDFFESIPFETVYHDTWFDPQSRGKIVYHRHAEVLVPTQLSTAAIRFIICRSQAEYETLLYLLPPGISRHWVNRIRVYPGLTFGRWSFVERVQMTREAAIFHFNVGVPPGPFKARAQIVETQTARKWEWSQDAFEVKRIQRIPLNLRNPQDYTVRFWLDDQLAYSGRYQEERLPF